MVINIGIHDKIANSVKLPRVDNLYSMPLGLFPCCIHYFAGDNPTYTFLYNTYTSIRGYDNYLGLFLVEMFSNS